MKQQPPNVRFWQPLRHCVPMCRTLQPSLRASSLRKTAVQTQQPVAETTGKPKVKLPVQGVWVLATIKGSVAARAGVQQGDQVLAVNGRSVEGETAYRVAAMIQLQSQPRGGGDADAQPQSTTINLTVRALQIWCSSEGSLHRHTRRGRDPPWLLCVGQQAMPCLCACHVRTWQCCCAVCSSTE